MIWIAFLASSSDGEGQQSGTARVNHMLGEGKGVYRGVYCVCPHPSSTKPALVSLRQLPNATSAMTAFSASHSVLVSHLQGGPVAAEDACAPCPEESLSGFHWRRPGLPLPFRQGLVSPQNPAPLACSVQMTPPQFHPDRFFRPPSANT